jgi:hypothetical protein
VDESQNHLSGLAREVARVHLLDQLDAALSDPVGIRQGPLREELITALRDIRDYVEYALRSDDV